MNLNKYEPCDHPGLPCGKECECQIRGTVCEKSCACPESQCGNRFTGCICKVCLHLKYDLCNIDHVIIIRQLVVQSRVLASWPEESVTPRRVIHAKQTISRYSEYSDRNIILNFHIVGSVVGSDERH